MSLSSCRSCSYPHVPIFLTPPDEVHQGVRGRDIPLLSAAARQVARPRLVEVSSRPARASTARDADVGAGASAGSYVQGNVRVQVQNMLGVWVQVKGTREF